MFVAGICDTPQVNPHAASADTQVKKEVKAFLMDRSAFFLTPRSKLWLQPGLGTSQWHPFLLHF